MSWAQDSHGLVFKSNELKLYFDGHHTWAMKLSQLPKQKGNVKIITYSLPDLDYVKEQLGRRPHHIWLLCNTKFKEIAQEIKNTFPLIHVGVRHDIHSKVLLISPNTVYITSANFGRSRWHETSIGVRSKEAHDAYLHYSFVPLWDSSEKLRSYP